MRSRGFDIQRSQRCLGESPYLLMRQRTSGQPRRAHRSVSPLLVALLLCSFIVLQELPSAATAEPRYAPTYSSYLGGEGTESGRAVAAGPEGSVYVTGDTTSEFFATTPSSSDGGPRGSLDAFVARVDSNGRVSWVTTFGGSDRDVPLAIVVAADGSSYVGGSTTSGDFPAQDTIRSENTGCVGEDRDCAEDGFITKLSPDGTVVTSTYLGGSDLDHVNDLALDATGNVWVAGHTKSKGLSTRRALQHRIAGNSDLFVMKLNRNLTKIRYSTYLGGRRADAWPSLAVTPRGHLGLIATTHSADFPIVDGFQRRNGGLADGVYLRLSGSGERIAYSTYLGGRGGDSAGTIVVDDGGRTYISGDTDSTDFPTRRAFQPRLAGWIDGFIMKIGRGGRLVYSSYVGGSTFDVAWDVETTPAGQVFIAGQTDSEDFPTRNAFQPTRTRGECITHRPNCVDAFLLKLGRRGGLQFSTFLGGSRADAAYALTLGHKGVYMTGMTESPDFPQLDSPKPVMSGLNDAFLVRVSTGD